MRTPQREVERLMADAAVHLGCPALLVFERMIHIEAEIKEILLRKARGKIGLTGDISPYADCCWGMTMSWSTATGQLYSLRIHIPSSDFSLPAEAFARKYVDFAMRHKYVQETR